MLAAWGVSQLISFFAPWVASRAEGPEL